MRERQTSLDRKWMYLLLLTQVLWLWHKVMQVMPTRNILLTKHKAMHSKMIFLTIWYRYFLNFYSFINVMYEIYLKSVSKDVKIDNKSFFMQIFVQFFKSIFEQIFWWTLVLYINVSPLLFGWDWHLRLDSFQGLFSIIIVSFFHSFNLHFFRTSNNYDWEAKVWEDFGFIECWSIDEDKVAFWEDWYADIFNYFPKDESYHFLSQFSSKGSIFKCKFWQFLAVNLLCSWINVLWWFISKKINDGFISEFVFSTQVSCYLITINDM